MRRVSPLLFHQPAKVCILQSHLRSLDAASKELDSVLILLSGFTEAIGIPGLLDAIGLNAVEELVAIKEEKIITASRDLDTTLSSSFCSCILVAIVEQLTKLKFLVQQAELNG